jgi:hypothetical protein
MIAEKTCVIVPCRGWGTDTTRLEQLQKWFDSWYSYLSSYKDEVEIVVIWDGDNKEGLDYFLSLSNVTIFNWTDIDKDLKQNAWIIPRKTDCVRSYGLLYAYRKGANVWSLDDDVRLQPDTNPLKEYLSLYKNTYDCSGYYSVGKNHTTPPIKNQEVVNMRGYPFSNRWRAPGIQYGGWNNIPDLDAFKQLEFIGLNNWKFHSTEPVPTHLGFTGCIMNTFIPHQWVPTMYQLLMGLETYGIDRYGDIWSGLFAKRISDHLKCAILINGAATVKHNRASNPWSCVLKETPGVSINEELWEFLLRTQLSKENNTPILAYKELVTKIRKEWFAPNSDYGKKLKDALGIWCALL